MMSASEEFTCRDLVALVTDYLERSLSNEDRERFEEHLAECPGCETYLEQMRQTISMLGTLAEDTVPADVQKDMLPLFRQWKSERRL